jgi:hypothetical protein
MTKEKYPKPDRSDQTPNFEKADDYDQIDLGWSEGVLSDDRPYRAEAWTMDKITMLTYFFSTKGLENYDEASFVEFLTKEGLVEFVAEQPQRYVSISKITDAGGNEMWSVNVAIGNEDRLFAKDSTDLKRY